MSARKLAAQDIEVRFDGLAAVADVSVALESREILGLIGPNGAGKTTLVNVLSGFQAPTKGRVLLDGELVARWPTHKFRRKGIARTFQAGRLFTDMSALDNVEVPAVNLGLSRRCAAERARELLDWIGLGGKAHLPAGVLSHTDECRLGIARALVMAPAFALLDEPVAGMSDLECDDLVRLIADVPKKFGCGVLLIEHNMRVVMSVCDRVHVLDCGRTIAEGTPVEVQANPMAIAAYLGTGYIRQTSPGSGVHAA